MIMEGLSHLHHEQPNQQQRQRENVNESRQQTYHPFYMDNVGFNSDYRHDEEQSGLPDQYQFFSHQQYDEDEEGYGDYDDYEDEEEVEDEEDEDGIENGYGSQEPSNCSSDRTGNLDKIHGDFSMDYWQRQMELFGDCQETRDECQMQDWDATVGQYEHLITNRVVKSHKTTFRGLKRDDWSDVATYALLDAWGKKFLKLNRGILKMKHWGDVAEFVKKQSGCIKTDVQCKNRVDTLKKKYKYEKKKQSLLCTSGSKWQFYKLLDKLMNMTTKQTGIPGAVDAGQMISSDTSSSPIDWRADTSENSSSSPEGKEGEANSSRKRKFDGSSVKMLARAITKFSKIYEKIENSKNQQLLDLEKTRMEFSRDLEVHRMQLLMQAQIELAKFKKGVDIDVPARNTSG